MGVCGLHTMKEMQVVVTKKKPSRLSVVVLTMVLSTVPGWYCKKNYDQAAKLGISSLDLMTLSMASSFWCSWLLFTSYGVSKISAQKNLATYPCSKHWSTLNQSRNSSVLFYLCSSSKIKPFTSLFVLDQYRKLPMIKIKFKCLLLKRNKEFT